MLLPLALGHPVLGHYLLQLLVCTGAHAVHPHLVESFVYFFPAAR